jgi:DNA-binding XRE family transcriptional regulator
MQHLDSSIAPQPAESLALYLHRLRLQRGLSQKQVADAAGIHLQSLGKIERGRTRSLNHKTSSGLAYALGIPKDYLEAACKGTTVAPSVAIKFCPCCWKAGMVPELMWLDVRAQFCFLCGTQLRHVCVGCQEPIMSLKHRFCPYFGTSYLAAASTINEV